VLDWVFDKDPVYIYGALGLLLFIGLRTLVDLRGEIEKAGGKKNLIVDKEYTSWQTKKSD
jgi:hypothetical protein